MASNYIEIINLPILLLLWWWWW